MTFFFWMLAIVVIISAVMVITRKNPVHSALWLVLTLICLAGIYIVIGAEFLAMVMIFVYAGGIMLLYLFMIMLMSMREKRVPERYFHTQWPIGCLIAGLIFLAILKYVPIAMFKGATGEYDPARIESLGGNIQAFAKELFSNYIFPFEVASILLVVAMLGAVVLGRSFGLKGYLQEEEEEEAISAEQSKEKEIKE